MKVEVVIEIPKGNDQRWHLDYYEPIIKNFGPIKDVIPINDGKMPVAYGYIEDIFNHDEVQEAPVKENVDVIIFAKRSFSIGEKTEAAVFGVINCSDGDHKILAHDSSFNIESWGNVPMEEKKLITDFFGYKHKITSIGDKEEAERYLEEMKKIPL